MSDMNIAEAAFFLRVNPCPIICLDTCDFLDVIRSLEEDENPQALLARRLIKTLNAEPDRVKLVITSLVEHEWRQNVEASRKRAFAYLQETDQRIRRVLDSCIHVDIQSAGPSIDLARLPLVQGLVVLAESLMNRAMIMEQDDSCIQRALSRVMDRRRPSHKGAIKDSIHLEHYLELSRQLSQAVFTEPIIFVSANKTDFWDGPPQIHRDLKDELDAAGLQFFGKLDAALGRLGI